MASFRRRDTCFTRAEQRPLRVSATFGPAPRQRLGIFARVWPIRQWSPPLRRGLILLVTCLLVMCIAVPLAAFTLGGASQSPRADMMPGASTSSSTPTVVPTSTPGVPDNTALNGAEGCANGSPAPASRAIRDVQRVGAGAPTPREVALTFDDGPSPSSSPAILDLLERTGTPATFFVIGQQVARWPALVQREWHDGFAIGVHTWDHPLMTHLSYARMGSELSDTAAALHRALGSDACIWLWRPPYEDYNQQVIQAAVAQGLTTITWNVDPRDWSRPGANAIVQRALSAAGPGAIILFHDGPAQREQTAAALPTVISTLHARGFKLVTVPQLLADAHFPGIHMTPPGPLPHLCATGGSLSHSRPNSLQSMSRAAVLFTSNLPLCVPRDVRSN